MSNFSDFIGGGGGGGGSPFPTMFFQKSMTWACPVEMEVMVYVIGAGGSGAQVSFTALHGANGGGAGGCAVSKLTLAAQNYTFVIGSGGASRGDQGTGTTYSGVGFAGGNTSMSGSGMTTMTGNGGGAGQFWNSGSGTLSVGGTATGGNLYNNTGGGSNRWSITSANTRSAAGGGAVGFIGAGQNGIKSTTASGGGGLYQELGYGGSCVGMTTMDSYREGTSNAIPTHQAMQYKFNGAVSSEPFSGLKRHSSTNYRVPAADATTGASLFPYYQSSAQVCPAAGPFDGGMGIGINGLAFAGSGTCGGGGGGINYAASGQYNSRPGGGGRGIIIICPLSIGA